MVKDPLNIRSRGSESLNCQNQDIQDLRMYRIVIISLPILKTNINHVMFDETLQRIREKITSLQYVMTLHAEEEMNDDNLTT